MDKKITILFLIVCCCFLVTEAGKKGRKPKVPLRECESPVWNAHIVDNWILPDILNTTTWKYELKFKGLDAKGRYKPGKKLTVFVQSHKAKGHKRLKLDGFIVTIDQHNPNGEATNPACGVGHFIRKKKGKMAMPEEGCSGPLVYNPSPAKFVKKAKGKWVAPMCGEVVMRATVRGENGKLYYDDGDVDEQYHLLTAYLSPAMES